MLVRLGTLRELLNPEAVALIGATEKESSVGRIVLSNLLHTTNRPLYPVNPKRETVLGVQCFPSIGDVPSHVTLAVIVTPAPTVPDIVEACGKAGVSVAVILSSGFTEAERAECEKKILAARRQHGLRVIGPNSLGIILPHIGLNATFLQKNPKPGKIALIAPLLGDSILDWGDTVGIGISLFASLGAMIDVGYGDLIDLLTFDYNTKSLMIYMETVGNAKRFLSASRGFALSKPIIVLKPGRSKAGTRLLGRRGRPAGNDRCYDAVFRRLGIVRVAEVADLFNMAKVLDSRKLPRGPRLAVITNAGDVGIMAAETLAELGGELAEISGGSLDRRDLFLPEQWPEDYRVDSQGQEDLRRYVNTVEVCLNDDGVDGILVIYTPRVFAGVTDLAQAMIELSGKTAKPVIVTWIGGAHADEGRRILVCSNVPAYATPEEAVKTYFYMYQYHRNLELIYETPGEVKAGIPLMNYLKAVVRKALKGGKHILPSRYALDLLKNYRIDAVRTVVATNIDQVGREIRNMGVPLSLTIRPLHEGGEEQVILLTNEEDVVDACREAGKRLDAEDVEIVLQKQPAPNFYRLKLESRRDPEFRTLLHLHSADGAGEDLGIGLPPLNQTLARRLLEGVKLYPALRDGRLGRQTLARLEHALLAFSNLVTDFAEIERMELVLSVGESRSLASDVKVILARNVDDSSPYPHLAITPYPAHYITTWNLPDGTEVLLRPIRPEDKLMLQEMLAGLSKETLLRRYLGGVREITDDLVIRSCNVDYGRELAILAEIVDHGKKRMIGGCRLIQEPDTRKGEFAVLVHDDYQGMGLGAKLIDTLIGIAREKHLEEMDGLVLSGNESMLGLCRKLGFDVKSEPDGLSRVSFSL